MKRRRSNTGTHLIQTSCQLTSVAGGVGTREGQSVRRYMDQAHARCNGQMEVESQ